MFPFLGTFMLNRIKKNADLHWCIASKFKFWIEINFSFLKKTLLINCIGIIFGYCFYICFVFILGTIKHLDMKAYLFLWRTMFVSIWKDIFGKIHICFDYLENDFNRVLDIVLWSEVQFFQMHQLAQKMHLQGIWH